MKHGGGGRARTEEIRWKTVETLSGVMGLCACVCFCKRVIRLSVSLSANRRTKRIIGKTRQKYLVRVRLARRQRFVTFRYAYFFIVNVKVNGAIVTRNKRTKKQTVTISENTI